MNISRNAVTQAGEHALTQVISLELAEDASKVLLENTEEINKYLPTDGSIKLMKIQKMPEDFSARRSCDSRTFEVYIPVRYLFLFYRRRMCSRHHQREHTTTVNLLQSRIQTSSVLPCLLLLMGSWCRLNAPCPESTPSAPRMR